MSRRMMGALILFAVLLAVLLLYTCRPEPTPIPEKERKTSDSLEMTKPGHAAQVETLTVRETLFVRQSNRTAAVAGVSLRTADSLRTVAIVAQRAAETAGDTASLWRRVAMVNRAEADTLRVALDTMTAARANEQTARLAADRRATLEASRRVALEDFSRRLEADLARSSPPCRWLIGLARCPTRKETVVLTVVAGAGAALVAKLKPWQMVSP